MAVYAYGKRIPKIDPSSWIFPTATIIGKVIIGANCYIGAGTVIRGDYGKIKIGNGVSIEENVTIHARAGGKTIIEDNATIGHAAMIHNCIIRHDAVIGMQATISDYAEVGEFAIIGEAALVKSKQKIAPHKIAVGSPAKEIKEVPPAVSEFWQGVNEVYRDLAHSYPKKLRKLD
ncbi:MAG: gamma carbonic anhydrase family protein [Promethearchaeia archaeon]|nr:MAG: gamma carbonic anhydrase family protein [Candidatus Lokiarchaeia archaeon]